LKNNSIRYRAHDYSILEKTREGRVSIKLKAHSQLPVEEGLKCQSSQLIKLLIIDWTIRIILLS
jgi:hypothetical protein